jgi:DNA repair protein RecO (recombination protein O)
MIEKTKGIILNQLKYTDSGIITRIYTHKFGRLSFLIRGMRKKKTGKHNIFFQPLFILDLEINYKSSREMQTMKEFSVSYAPSDIHLNIKKSSVAIFLGEVLTSVLKEESPHDELFEYLEKSIIHFDRSTEGFSNFHIAFLAGLTSFLGFEPGNRNDPEEILFDMTNGRFVHVPPVHGNYANEEISDILARFFVSSYETASKIALTGALRNEVLETLVRYYSLHLPGLKNINSLRVLKEVYS